MFFLFICFNFSKKKLYNLWILCLCLIFINKYTPFNQYNVTLMNETILSKIVYLLNNSYISILLIFCILVLVKKTLSFYLIITLILLWINTQNEYYINVLDYFWKTNNNNNTLINGLLLIHPLLTYSSVCIIISLNLYKKYNTSINFFNSDVYNKSIYKLVFSAYAAIILGSYWAQQETNWGGWWNWDPIEMISIFIWILSLCLIHFYSKKTNIKILFLKNALIVLVLAYLLSRYDILNSIHSFVSSSSNNKYFELKIFIFIWIVLYSSVCLLLFLKKNIIFSNITTNVFSYLYFLIICYTMYIIVNSFFFRKNLSLNCKLLLWSFSLLNLIIFLKFKGTLINLLMSGNIEFYFLKKSYIFFKTIKLNNHSYIYVLIIILFLTANQEVFYVYSLKIHKNYECLYNYNENWFNLKKTNLKNRSDKNYIITHIYKNSYFETLKNFFSQSIETNIYFNNNKIILNKVLYVTQKYLYMIVLSFFTFIIYNLEKNYFNLSIKVI